MVTREDDEHRIERRVHRPSLWTDLTDDVVNVGRIVLHVPLWLGQLAVHEQVPRKVKMRLLLSTAAIVLPWGRLVRKRFRVLSVFDDVVLAVLMLNDLFEHVPRHVHLECWGGSEDDLENFARFISARSRLGTSLP